MQFGIDNTQEATAEALVQWSVEGTTIQRRVTIAPGVSISGTGQGVAVTMWDTTPIGSAQFPAPWSANGGVTYNVFASVSKGVRPPSKSGPTLCAPWTTQFDQGNPLFTDFGAGFFLVDNATAIATTTPTSSNVCTIPIPQDAGITSALVTATSFRQFGSGNTSASFGPENFQATFLMGTAGLYIWSPVLFPEWMPIPLGADTLQLAAQWPYNSISNIGAFCVVFGIDG